MYDVEIYQNINGKSGVKEYIESLQGSNNKDSNIKFNKIISYVRMLKREGLSLGEPYIKRIDSELWELRPLRDRILFAYCNSNKFVLLSVFMKQTNKTPKREIIKAKGLLKDYKRRSDLNE